MSTGNSSVVNPRGTVPQLARVRLGLCAGRGLELPPMLELQELSAILKLQILQNFTKPRVSVLNASTRILHNCLRIQSAIINRRGRTSGFHETARRSARYCPAAPDAPQGCPRGARRSAALTRAGRRQPWHRWIDAWVCPRADAGRHDGGARFLDLRPHSTDPMCAHSQATALRPARSRMRMCPWRSRMYPLSWSATAAIDTVDRGHPSTWASRSWVRSML